MLRSASVPLVRTTPRTYHASRSSPMSSRMPEKKPASVLLGFSQNPVLTVPAFLQIRLASDIAHTPMKPARPSGVTRATTKFYHTTSLALAVLFPTALVLSPSALNVPVDVLLSTVVPIHAWFGMNNVIGDYVPRGLQGLARLILLMLLLITCAGMLLSTFQSVGPTETIKCLWRKPEPK